MYLTIGVLTSSKLDVLVLAELLRLASKHHARLLDCRPQAGNHAGYYVTLKRDHVPFSEAQKEAARAEVYEACGRL